MKLNKNRLLAYGISKKLDKREIVSDTATGGTVQMTSWREYKPGLGLFIHDDMIKD